MPDTLTLTNAQLESVAQGLSALDGITTKDGFAPFKFDEDTTWNLAVKNAAVTHAISVLNSARKSLAKQHGVTEGMKITPENSANVAAFMDSLDSLMEKPALLPSDFSRIHRANLGLGKNAIPQSVLAKLMVILED